MPYRLYNTLTREYIKDLSFSPPIIEEFNNGKDCIEYYEEHCNGMNNIIIFKVPEEKCKCKIPLVEFNFNTDYCKRCDNLVAK